MANANKPFTVVFTKSGSYFERYLGIVYAFATPEEAKEFAKKQQLIEPKGSKPKFRKIVNGKYENF